MTAADKTFKWMLWPSHALLSIGSDEFVADGFRVQLRGDMLELSLEGSRKGSPVTARTLAEKYVEAFANRLGMPLALMSMEDWLKRTTPPFLQNRTISHTRDDRTRVARVVREARNELLASEDEALRRCYDYFQDALEHTHSGKNEEAAYDAYKVMEVLKQRFGNEDKAVRALGSKFKDAKRAANEPRHIPEKFEPMVPPASPLKLAQDVIREYERYLLRGKKET
jgi:hypothetical protein